jgi:glutamate synthase (NADPH/NADH) large chain
MTGGIAWIFDADGAVLGQQRYHAEFLEAQALPETSAEQQAALEGLLREHVRLTGSKLASNMLASWAEVSPKFVLFTPKPQA